MIREFLRPLSKRPIRIHRRTLLPTLILLTFALSVSSSPVQTALADRNSTGSQLPPNITATTWTQHLTDKGGEAAYQDFFSSDANALTVVRNELRAGHAPDNSATADLYSPAQRWGYGFDPLGANKTILSLGDLNYTAITGSLFQNWSAFDNKAPYAGLDFYPMVGAWNTYRAGDCTNVANMVNSHPELYPDGTRWVVGNEIGFDLPISPKDYATHFTKWQKCLKNIAADHQISYLVGSGAILSEKIILPGRAGACATTLDYHNGSNYSGYAYWKTYLTILKTNYPTQLPDFYTAHGFTYCAPSAPPGNTGWWNVPYFQQEIKDYRLLMKALGVQDKELIINEFGPLYKSVKLNATAFLKYLCDTTKFMLTKKDKATDNPQIGNPNDGNHYVQRWMWYNLNAGVTTGNRFPSLALLNTSNGLTKLGRGYNDLVRQTPANCGVWALNFQ